MLSTVLVTILISSFIILYYKFKNKYNYWTKRGIPQIPPTFFFGNYKPYMVFEKTLHENVDDLCKTLPNEPLIGAYFGTKPVLIVQDPELVKLVTSKDFYYFHAREVSEYCERETLTQDLFYAYSDNWKVWRQNMTPFFTSIKLKNMFAIIDQCARTFEKVIDENKDEDMTGVFAGFTMDCICSCAFGVDPKVMTCKDDSNPFKKISQFVFDVSNVFTWKMIARWVWPEIFYGLNFKLFDVKIEQFFQGLVNNVMESRDGKPSSRQDFVDLMLSLKENKVIYGDSIDSLKSGDDREKVGLEVTDKMIAAQCVVMFAAGYDTSAVTSAAALFHIAKDQRIQDKVLEEVDKYFATHENLQFDCVTEMVYLDQVLDETLRLYPVLGVIFREVYQEYTFPNGLKVKPGMRIHLPVYSLQKNPLYFDNPEEFRPERFSPEEKKNINPNTYFPFGKGPRTCIGTRLAKINMIVALLTVLKKYRVELAEGTASELVMEPLAMVTQSKTKILLKMTPREGWEKRVYK